MDGPRLGPQSPPGDRSSRARSRSDRWQKQRGKTPSLAATRGHATALGHLGCHKNKVLETCFGRCARRAAHVSDLRRSILRSGGGGRTLSGDVEPRCSLQPSRAAEAALPDARSPCGECGAEPLKLGTLGTTLHARASVPKATQARTRSRWTSLHPPLPVPKRRAALVRGGSQVRLGGCPLTPCTRRAPVCVRRLPRWRETRRKTRICE